MTDPIVFPALVLKAFETGDTSEVLHVLTPGQGRLSLYARGLQNPKSRLRGILQPLSLVEVTAVQRDGAEVATLREAALLRDHQALAQDLERLALALLLAEATALFCPPGHGAPDLFEALLESLDALHPEAPQPAEVAAAAGLLALLHLAGVGVQFAPDILRPWPAGTPRPEAFALAVENATIALPRRVVATPAWPAPPAQDAAEVLLPPLAVRFVHAWGSGAELPRLPVPQRQQLLLALFHTVECHGEGRLRSLDFWRRTSVAG